MPVIRRPRRLVAAALPLSLLPLLLLPLLSLTACAGPGDVRADPVDKAAAHARDDRAGKAPKPGPRASPPLPVAPAEIPGLGPATRAAIPQESRQAVVVRGENVDGNLSWATLYERHPRTGWRRASAAWPSHNAVKGWTHHHVQNDLRSPIGVFGLTDAGGLLPDPGTRLPYDQGPAFTARGTGSLGEPLEGSFDYVVAINYNRRPGTTPLDWTRPLGEHRGGGIWIHVDHDGPTQGCVSLQRPHMRELLLWLDPSKHPVVVMGDETSLAR
ncbi:hypothetical protein [Streptomyces sp. TRM64462]|uniref:hypothetical protein n=1 Tax=Streptomyces sp. TRM64462 TaxID=2741726 RepID=UPI001586F4A3|nr:hypothetical protein [Streptomyces sp. TRM64462]